MAPSPFWSTSPSQTTSYHPKDERVKITATCSSASWRVLFIPLLLQECPLLATAAESTSVLGCRDVILGPSTIPNAGWGVFAARDFQMGDEIGMPSIAIPFLLPVNVSIPPHQQETQTKQERSTNPNSFYHEDDSSYYDTTKFGALQEFLWEAANMGGFGEASFLSSSASSSTQGHHNGHRVQLFLPGLASLINHHPTLNNVIPGGLTVDPDEYQDDEERRIMAGSSTAYHNLVLIANTEQIFAGDELFFDYTQLPNSQHQLMPSPHYSYFGYHDENHHYNHNHGPDAAADGNDKGGLQMDLDHGPITIPTATDYATADRIVQDLWEEYQSLSDSSGSTTEMIATIATGTKSTILTHAQWIDVLYRLRTEILIHGESFSEYSHDRAANRKMDGYERVLRDRVVLASLLPRTVDELERAYKIGTDKAMLLPSPNLAKLVDGSNEHYFCLDHLREGESTIKGAGKGAFATRKFQKGSVVTVAPLVYIPDKANAMAVESNGSYNNTLQLLENYCFGHRHANLLLCPTTHAALINHHHGAGKANVQLRWAQNLTPSSPSTHRTQIVDILVGSLSSGDLDAVASDLSSFATTRLAFEYVAINDIEPGDEIILDYGAQYEQALREHKEKNVYRAIRNDDYLHPDVLNREAWPIVLSTDSFMMQGYEYECNLYPNLRLLVGAAFSGWEDFESTRMVDHSNWPEDIAAIYDKNAFASWYPCKVVKIADESLGLYDIEVYTKGNTLPPRVATRRLNCPRNRIRFVSAPYQSNQHLPWAFRHYIPIPDDIFPLRWRNDYKPSDVWKLGGIEESSRNIDYEESLRNAACGLYLAKSNIPNSGFGLYTAVDIPSEGLVVGSTLPAVVRNGKDIEDMRWPGKDYVWSGSSFEFSHDGNPEFDAELLNGLFGALANFHTGLVNMNMKRTSMKPKLDRRIHHGAGAFSDFQNSAFVSDHPIDAGEELFVSYGEEWLEQRSQFEDVPLKDNFVDVDRIVASIWSLLNLEGATIDEAVIPGLLKTIHAHFIHKHRTKMAFHTIRDMTGLNAVISRNGTAMATTVARSQEWLETNGFCMDHIYVKESTIPQAGVGAFSRRHLKAGTVIHTSPLIAAPRGLMETNYTGDIPPTINEKQIMLNYHFGHPDSSIMFFPLSQAIAINHRAETPNARVEFSQRERKSRYLLHRPLRDIYSEKYSAMVLDVVALRDIAPDEEIFIDYGREWQEVWDDNVRKWKSPCTKNAAGTSATTWTGSGTDLTDCFESSYMVTYEMNEDILNPKYFPWSNVHMTVCSTNMTVPWEGGQIVYLVTKKPSDSEFAMDLSVRKKFLGVTFDDEAFDYPLHAMSGEGLHPCEIVQSDSDARTFDVMYFFVPDHVPSQYEHPDLPDARVVVKYNGLDVKDAQHINKPLTADWHDPQAFRHEIHIPGDSFPELWKDLLG